MADPFPATQYRRFSQSRFRDRVAAQFLSRENRAYLARYVAMRGAALSDDALAAAAAAYANGTAAAANANGAAAVCVGNRSPDFWAEVRALNGAFVAGRFAAARAPDDAADEPYHMRMFEADSLRPPGLGHLNTGPYYALREDQEGPGDPGRSAAQAIAEYWGDGWAATDMGCAGGLEGPRGVVGGGAPYSAAPPTRFMRREHVPFWQKGGRVGYDEDIDETLGLGSRELGSHVRRWDMSGIGP